MVANRTPQRASGILENVAQQARPTSTAWNCGAAASTRSRVSSEDDACRRGDPMPPAAACRANCPPVPAELLGKDALAHHGSAMYGRSPDDVQAEPGWWCPRSFAAQRARAPRPGQACWSRQAAEAFYNWRGVRPAAAPCWQLLRAELQARSRALSAALRLLQASAWLSASGKYRPFGSCHARRRSELRGAGSPTCSATRLR
ncbi:hypothetical protein ACU4GD_26640 [Cupriavidus basilensis]